MSYTAKNFYFESILEHHIQQKENENNKLNQFNQWKNITSNHTNVFHKFARICKISL